MSVDSDVLGVVHTEELVPMGSAVSVTNSNRILYIHLMADYRLNKQLKEQCEAFRRGFKALIADHWLRCFSPSEIQRLISGSDGVFDVQELRRHARYMGGYHDGHKVIKWMWQVVEELTPEEQGKFLKFITSCSKPPVLGFGSLSPAFSVRLVANTDQDDADHDTALGVIAGFFNVGGADTDRLPTSSTCFNLLKLPPYKKKSTLREKLRYAINAGAGFELS